MKLVHTENLDDELTKLSPEEIYDVYNGMDCLVDLELGETLLPQVRKQPAINKIYEFELALQGPVLDMELRGLAVDVYQVSKMRNESFRSLLHAKQTLNKYANAIWGKELNANSRQQVAAFFYDAMQYSRIYYRGKLSVARDALEKIGQRYYARPIILAVLEVKDLTKTLSVLNTKLDANKRFRTSFNIGGTVTGRWSSSESAFGYGMNAQNITEKLRRCFIADPGKKMAYIDLTTAESRAMGYLAGDEAYITACESGDLHTQVAKLVWPDLAWTGDAKADRALAEQLFYRHFSYRDMSKKGGHGTNYVGTPWTMSQHLKVPVTVMETFQAAYFTAFPGIPEFHSWIATELQVEGKLTTPFGRTRMFWGRRNEPSTIREAVAFMPQSLVADYLNKGLLRVFLDRTVPVQLLLQIHDAILIQYPEELENEIIAHILPLMTFPLNVTDQHKQTRKLLIPSDAATGWNWGKYDPKRKLHKDCNPDGLRDWDGNDERKRRSDPSVPLLDRVF